MAEFDSNLRQKALNLIGGPTIPPIGPDYWNSSEKRLIDYSLATLLALPAVGISFLMGVQIYTHDGQWPFVSLPRFHPKYGNRHIWKARTMYPNAHLEFEAVASNRTLQQLKSDGDPRVTHVGAKYRENSFDELPQILNILLRDMRMVGPRPLSKKEYETDVLINIKAEPFTTFDDYLRKGYDYGATSLPALLGRHRLPFEQRLHLDVMYAQMCNPLADMRIFLLTLKVPWAKTGK